MRGKLDAEVFSRHCCRIIPAHAGQTMVTCRVMALWTDHPRACGANFRHAVISLHDVGSSPRMRGKRRIVDTRHNRLRIIPAHAGQTKSKRVRAFSMPDHPRACGANSCDAASGRIVTGSSPRMRGKHGHLVRRNDRDRIIPAHAGQTSKHVDVRSAVDGSSPRMRGKLIKWGNLACARRIIPAHAGQTVTTDDKTLRRADHPRACGANKAGCGAHSANSGSSPRMRGKPLICGAKPNCVRIIPAHAGQTRRNPYDESNHPDHPRACGANHLFIGISHDVSGSSPRMRGKRHHHLRHGSPKRIIPAHAGQTPAW